MNSKAMFVHFHACLAAYTAYRDGDHDSRVGQDVAETDSPIRLAVKLKARLLGRQTIGLNWLLLAVRLLEARPNITVVTLGGAAHV